ncbi:hypothetical protein [Paracoccus onubensis]|uniref:hypothetical protein n=1 Tax=Paracoccus onubensis TaxID=1675788 RepID=UPI001600D04B|nr:hypothetical protein [Paracoccus onubensis]
MTDQPEKDRTREKAKKERDKLKDAVKSLDDEDEKRPGTDDEDDAGKEDGE